MLNAVSDVCDSKRWLWWLFFSLNEIAQNVKSEAFIEHIQGVTVDVFISTQTHQPRVEMKPNTYERIEICDLKHFCGSLSSLCMEP